MKKKQRYGSLQGSQPKKNKGITLLSSMKESYLSKRNNAGKKEDGLEKSSNASLYDTCDICPLSVYIDVVCDNRLERLIISGNPTCEELKEAKYKLIAEFSELCSGNEEKAFNEAVRSYYYLRTLIIGYESCISLIVEGKFDSAIEFLNNNGIKCKVPADEKERLELIRSIETKIKGRILKFRQAERTFKALCSKKGEKPTRKYFNHLLVMLSTCEMIKMQLDRNKLTLAEFAEYLNVFNDHQQYLKTLQIKKK